MAAKAWKKYLTEQEYAKLPYVGRVMADYWTEWLPKTCQHLLKEGENLAEFFDRKGNEDADLQMDLMRQGMSEDGAWEIVKEEIFLPPEK